jgi:hypothetical protein
MTTYEQPEPSDLEIEALIINLLAQLGSSDLCHDIVLARIEALSLVGAPITPFLQALETRLNRQVEAEASVVRGLKVLDELGL